MENKEGEKYVLCGFCQKPIHVDEFGGVQKGLGFFHAQCFLDHEQNKIKEDEK